jgi:hypothetical protein
VSPLSQRDEFANNPPQKRPQIHKLHVDRMYVAPLDEFKKDSAHWTPQKTTSHAVYYYLFLKVSKLIFPTRIPLLERDGFANNIRGLDPAAIRSQQQSWHSGYGQWKQLPVERLVVSGTPISSHYRISRQLQL